MGGFGNDLGATFSSGRDDVSGNVMQESIVNDDGFAVSFPERDVLLGRNNELRDLSQFSFADEDDFAKRTPDPNHLINQVHGVPPDPTFRDEVEAALTGGSALNWEGFQFDQLREEKNALNVEAIGDLATGWRSHGNDLKTKSETFKTQVREAISGKWEGASADAADAATQHLTHNSIYDFTPSSTELADRLDVLKDAFQWIKDNFPPTPNHELIRDGQFDRGKLNEEINNFNSWYYLDDTGRLRSNVDRGDVSKGDYISAQDAIDWMNEIQRSIEAYQKAVHLFEYTYNPTVETVVSGFPTLPGPPNLNFTPPGQGPGTGPGGTPPGGGGGGGTPPIGGGGGGTPPFNTPNFIPPDTGKTPPFPDVPGTGDPTDPSNNPQIPQTPTTSPVTQGLNSAMDAASKGLNSGIGAATQAAQKAAQGAAGQKTPALREGALGLGDKPGAGAAKGMGGGATGGGGGASGSGGPGLSPAEPAARLSSQPTTAVSTMPAASSSGAAGMGGMGAPMGGGGPGGGKGGADGKEHKGNKALRTRKHGSDIVGDTDGVVPVLGDTEPPPTEESQPTPPRRRIPQRDTPWQPDTAPQSGPSRSPQTQQPSPAADQLMEQ
jgi:hypothetical protein